MADKKNLCAQIDTALHARVRQEQERTGKTLSEYVEQLITDYYKMKENTKMTGDSRTLAVQIPEELFLRLDAYLKRSGIKSKKQFLISLIEDALEQEEEDTAEQPETEESTNQTWMPTKKNNHPTGSRGDRLRLLLLHLRTRCGIVEIADGRCGA